MGPVYRLQTFLQQLTVPEIDTETLLNEFAANMPYTDSDIAKIEHATNGQHSNANWVNLRRQMITASNFKRVVTRTETLLRNPIESCTALLAELLKGPTDHLDNVASINWGRKKEQPARIMYTRIERKRHIGLNVRTTGLFVSKSNPFLGCSPDGIASCKCKSVHADWLIEIKCPYSKRLLSPKEAAVQCGCTEQDGLWSLDKNHKYFSQIQGQLGIAGCSKCELIVFTTKGIHVIGVPFDVDYYNYITAVLKHFVTQYYMSAVLSG